MQRRDLGFKNTFSLLQPQCKSCLRTNLCIHELGVSKSVAEYHEIKSFNRGQKILYRH